MTEGAYTYFLGSRPRNDVGFCRCHFNGGLVVQGVVCPKFRTMCRSYFYISQCTLPFPTIFCLAILFGVHVGQQATGIPLIAYISTVTGCDTNVALAGLPAPPQGWTRRKIGDLSLEQRDPVAPSPPFRTGLPVRCQFNNSRISRLDFLTRVFRIPRPDRPRPRPRPRRRPLIFDDFDLRKSSLSLAPPTRPDPPPRLRLRLHLRPRSNASPRLTARCLSPFPGAPDPPSHLDDCIARHPDDL